ncbi:hypothetical protein EGJ45_18145 [Stutzerimonas stutzeri]|nr:hypothetical protein EGJ45_18145 [Stutzerimonas stutzeri]RRW22889.1 hypothetical protein EGJ36_18200 [Stutzerimonas stutzeri]
MKIIIIQFSHFIPSFSYRNPLETCSIYVATHIFHQKINKGSTLNKYQVERNKNKFSINTEIINQPRAHQLCRRATRTELPSQEKTLRIVNFFRH